MLGRIKKHYHWIIAFLSVLVLCIFGGAANNFSGLHLIPVTETFGITRAQFASAQSIMNITGIATTFFSGLIVSKLGYRFAAGGVLLLSAGFYFGMAKAENFSVFLVMSALYGIFYPLCTTAGVTQIISIWFHKHRGLVLGAVTSATGFGSSILCMFQAAAIEKYSSWRASLILCAVLIFFTAILVLLLIRNKPEDMGLLPLGAGEEITSKKRGISQDAFDGRSFSSLIRRPVFWVMSILTACSTFLPYAFFYILIPYFVETGLSATEASAVNSAMMLILAGAKFGGGLLCDRIGPKKVVYISIMFSVAAMVLLTRVNSLSMAYFAAAIYALCLPLNTILPSLLGFSLLGYKSQAQYTGIFLGISCISGIMGSILPNRVFDLCGSYKPVLWGTAALGTLLLVLYPLLYRMAKRDKEDFLKNSNNQ